MTLEIRLLGPVAVTRCGAGLPLGGPKQRAVLALLAARPGAIVSAERLIEALWGDDPPRTAATALQGHVSQLRRLLGPEVIVTKPPGYVLDVDPDCVDARRFERLVADAPEPAERADALRAALGLWHGPALADLVGRIDPLRDDAEQLEELRLTVTEDLFDYELGLARHGTLLPELEAFVRAEPLRDRATGQLMLALYRSGRQVDALAAYRRFRQALRETLGLEPGEELRELERRILRHDPGLAPPAVEAQPRTRRRLPLTVAAIGLEHAGDADAEVFAETTARAREAVRLMLEQHGGQVERAGTAVLGRFGAGTPNGDDPERALLAARAAVAAVEALGDESPAGVAIRARAGVATGESFAGESPAVEAALRLQAETAWGEVAADEATRAGARRRAFRIDRPLAGRTAELARLSAAYDDAVRERRSALVTLVGPAGIGKSRLAESLAASVPQERVLRARCLSYGDGIGLLPAAELVRGATGLSDDTTAAAARARLADLLPASERTEAAIEQLLAVLGLGDDGAEAEHGWAVRRLLETAAEGEPLVAIVEDLHWADPVFLEIAERLAEPFAAPLVVVATARTVPRGALRDSVLELVPLEHDPCGEIVSDLLGGEVDRHAIDVLVERSGGNPLYLEELVLDLRASGRLRQNGTWSLDDDATVSAPPSIQSLLAARLEGLPGEQRDLLGRASVLGRSFTRGELAALADGAELDALLEGLVSALVLKPSDGADDFEFRHMLIRDAAYAALPLELRAALHDRVALDLDGTAAHVPEREALTVYHLDQALRSRTTLAPSDQRHAAAVASLLPRLRALGRARFASGDPAAASTLLARALELEPGDALTAVELGRARFDGGDLPGAAEAFALAAAGPLADRARLGSLEVQLHTDPACDLDAAAAEIADLLASMRSQDDRDGTVEALLASAYVSMTRGSIEELGRTLEDGLEVAHRFGRSRAEAEMRFLLCGACWYGPLPADEGIARCEQVLAATRGRPIEEAAALQALGVLRAMRGEYEAARELVTRSRSIRREIGQAVGAAASAIDAGIVELLAGRHAEAEEIFRGGYAELERLGETGYFSTLATLLAAAVEAQGRSDESLALAQSAAAAAGTFDVVSQAGWRIVSARALAQAGAHEDAERDARAAVALADATDFLLLRGDAWAAVADVAAARGDAAGERSARATAVELLERKGLDPSAIAAWARV